MGLQKLLCVSFLSSALAAPIDTRLHPRQFPGLGYGAPPGSGQPPSEDVGGPRQWGVLYPQPPRRAPIPNDGSAPSISAAPAPESPLPVTTSPASLPDLPTPTAPADPPTVDPITSLSATTVVSFFTTFTTTTSIQPPPLANSSTALEPSTVLTTTLVTSTSIAIPQTSLVNSTLPTNSTLAPSTSGSNTTFIPSSTSFSIPTTAPTASPPGLPAGPLQLALVNNLASTNARAYVSAIEVSSGRVVMLTAGGSFYYLPETGSGVPQALSVDVSIPLPGQGQTLNIAIPGFVEGARVWFADGTLDFAVVSSVNGPALVEPTAVRRDDGSAGTNWGFVELAWVPNYGLFANLSFVDFVGMPLGLQLQTTSSGTQTVPGMPRDGVQQVCERLRAHLGIAKRYWSALCVETNGTPTRVISPAVLLSQQPAAFPGFFRRYVEKVWTYYAGFTLTIDTQNGNGRVACRVVGDELQCDGDNRGYARPTAEDIFGCNSGPFAVLEGDNDVHRAVVPRLCAAFNRGTLLLPGGDVQPALPPSSYYTARPYNAYSAIVHEVELEGRGYAFSYDDVAPSPEENVAGTVAAADPQVLTVYVGGM